MAIFLNRFLGFFFDLETEFLGEAFRPKNPQRVFLDPLDRIADKPDQTSFQIFFSMMKIEYTPLVVYVNRVDREVAADGIFFEVFDEADRLGMPPIIVIPFFPQSGDVDLQWPFMEGDRTIFAEGIRSLGDEGFFFLWGGVGGEIEIGERDAQ